MGSPEGLPDSGVVWGVVEGAVYAEHQTEKMTEVVGAWESMPEGPEKQQIGVRIRRVLDSMSQFAAVDAAVARALLDINNGRD